MQRVQKVPKKHKMQKKCNVIWSFQEVFMKCVVLTKFVKGAKHAKSAKCLKLAKSVKSAKKAQNVQKVQNV